MSRNTRVFVICLILTVLNLLNFGVRPILPMYVMDSGFLEYVLQINNECYSYLLSFSTLYLGYRLGRDSDLKNEYPDYVRSLAAGWFGSLLVLGVISLLSDDLLQEVAKIAVTYGLTSGHSVGATLFATMTLGWVTRDGVFFKRELNNVVLKPILVYNELLLLRTIFQSVQSYWMLTSGNRASLSWGGPMSSSFMGLVWVWYVSRMFRSGKDTNLEEDYGSILYTIWLPSIVLSVLTYSAHVLFYYFRMGMNDLFVLPVAYKLNLIAPTLQVFGVPLALLCYGYLNSKYRFISRLGDKTEQNEAETSE